MKLEIVLSLLLVINSCGDVAFNSSSKENSKNKPLSIETDSTNHMLNRELIEYGRYSTLLKNGLVPIDSRVFVGANTIEFKEIDKLNSLAGVSKETKQDFIEQNKEVKKLKNRFDVYAKIELVKVGKNVNETVSELYNNHPKSEGLILLSSVGLNKKGTESLIYVEKYDSEGIVEKKICFIQRNKYDEVVVRWFPIKKID